MLKTWNSKSGHPYWPRKKRQSVRLSYFNTANMGDYREAVVAFLRGINSKPDITAHRHQGSLKYGLGLNIEQTLPANFRAFARQDGTKADTNHLPTRKPTTRAQSVLIWL